MISRKEAFEPLYSLGDPRGGRFCGTSPEYFVERESQELLPHDRKCRQLLVYTEDEHKVPPDRIKPRVGKVRWFPRKLVTKTFIKHMLFACGKKRCWSHKREGAEV